jgi:hypothetical protein
MTVELRKEVRMSTTAKEERRALRAAAAAQASYLLSLTQGLVSPAEPTAQPCPG